MKKKGAWVKWVKGIKEYTHHDEHWGQYGTAESLYCTPQTSNTVC